MACGLYELRQNFRFQAKEGGFEALHAICNDSVGKGEFRHVGTSHTSGHRQLYATFAIGGADYMHFTAGDLQSMLIKAQFSANRGDAFAQNFVDQAAKALKDLELYEKKAEEISASYPRLPASMRFGERTCTFSS
jgi:hypothetical protein